MTDLYTELDNIYYQDLDVECTPHEVLVDLYTLLILLEGGMFHNEMIRVETGWLWRNIPVIVHTKRHGAISSANVTPETEPPFLLALASRSVFGRITYSDVTGSNATFFVRRA